jgi:3-dehydroquinate dehydratase-1
VNHLEKSVKIGNVCLGQGQPKSCVPLIGTDLSELLVAAEQVVVAKPDLVEWRIDYLKDCTFTTLQTDFAALRLALADLPMLVTLRTQAEGGELALTAAAYQQLLVQICQAGLADALDVEFNRGSQVVQAILIAAQAQGIPVILSQHDFQATAPLNVLTQQLQAMGETSADVVKMAVMPHQPQDVLTLMQATLQADQQLTQPLITMAMGDLGRISRLSGTLTGSTLSFATVSGASAPGQLDLATLKMGLTALA